MTKTVRGPEGLVIHFPDDTDEATINRVMSEAYAKRKAAQPQQPQQPQEQPVDATPPQSGVDKFITGLDRLPNLVGAGNFSSGFTKSDLSADEARGRFAQGVGDTAHAEARAATGILGPVDDWVIAGASEGLDAITGKDTGDFATKVKRSEALADRLREDHPLGSLVGDVAGFGYAGKALRAVAAPGAITAKGIPIIGGVAGEAATIAGLHGAAEGESLPQIAQDAATAAIFGKVLQGVGDKVVAPAAKWALPRIERQVAKLRGKGTSEEFKIPEHEVQRIADRMKMSTDEVRKGLDDYISANGVDANILQVVNADTAAQWEKLARGRKGAAEALRAGEEKAALERPDIVANAARRTGDAQSADEAIEGARGAAQKQATAVRQGEQDAAEEVTDIVTAQKRMEDANIEAAKHLENQRVAEESDNLAQTLRRAGQGIETDANVDAALAQYTTKLLREDGGLAQQPIKLTKEWIKAKLPGNPKRVSGVLKEKADSLPEGEARQRLLKAAEDVGTGKDVDLTIGDVDNVRRALNDGGVDANGARWSLGEAGDDLRAEAARQVPDYNEKYLKVFAGTKRGLAARDATKMILGKGANDAAADIEGQVARVRQDEGDAAANWILEGARDGALRAIAQGARDGEEALKAASNIIRNGDAIVRTAGEEGQRLVTAVHQTMENVSKISDEMAEIVAAAKRNKNQLSDGARKRLAELKRAANTQIAGIKQAIRRDTGALRAAQKVLSKPEGEFNSAVSGSKQNTGSVARGAIADEAGASPTGAIKVVEDLATPSVARKIEKVAGKETAEKLQAVGRTQSKAVANLSKAAARTKDDGGLGEEMSTAIEAAASLAGRAGPGYATAVGKRALKAFQHLGISNRGAKAIASAVLNNDAQYVARLVNRLAKTEQQRKVILDAVRSFLLGLNLGNVTSAR